MAGQWDYEDPYRFGPVMGEMDEYLLGEGTHRRIWQALGAHVLDHEGMAGTHFAVWAPNARRVSVVGDFNALGRPPRLDAAARRDRRVGDLLSPAPATARPTSTKSSARTANTCRSRPIRSALASQHPPETASVVRDIRGYGWKDHDWMATRAGRNARTAPISVYEVHLGSWRRRYGEGRPAAVLPRGRALIWSTTPTTWALPISN